MGRARRARSGYLSWTLARTGWLVERSLFVTDRTVGKEFDAFFIARSRETREDLIPDAGHGATPAVAETVAPAAASAIRRVRLWRSLPRRRSRSAGRPGGTTAAARRSCRAR